jgi:hypothetical protein
MTELTKEKEVSQKIQAILEENNMAIQPYLSFSEHGVAPRVRLVNMKEDESGDNQPEAAGNQNEDGPAEPSESQGS